MAEPVSFSLTLNGVEINEPINVTLINSGTHHRDNRNAIHLTTDMKGAIDFELSEAGFYLLEAAVTRKSAKDNSDLEHFTLYATLEVISGITELISGYSDNR